jgi:hypothetical protein
MSQYLISRIDRSPHITLYTDTEIEELEGESAHELVTWTNRKTGETTKPVSRVFSMIGAEPNSGRLYGSVSLPRWEKVLWSSPTFTATLRNIAMILAPSLIPRLRRWRSERGKVPGKTYNSLSARRTIGHSKGSRLRLVLAEADRSGKWTWRLRAWRRGTSLDAKGVHIVRVRG